MPVEIEAAIIGGLLSGSVVLLGVGLSEWFTRSRQRWGRVEGATFDLLRLISLQERLLRIAPAADASSSADEAVTSNHAQCMALLVEVRSLCSGSSRRAVGIRSVANEVIARLIVAFDAYNAGHLLEEQATLGGRLLNEAVFAQSENLSRRVDELRSTGIPSQDTDRLAHP
jgi:hypothetical protein